MHRVIATIALIVSVTLLFSVPAGATSDPSLLWECIETEHFRVTYYSGEYEMAVRIAELAESILARLAPAVGWPPSERVEIAVTDITDSANAFAGALPYDSIRMFATAPDDLSPLGDVDDWFLELITHEFTHVLHTDHIRGIPAIVNAVLGKTYAPNQVQPRWILEGLAVFEESSKTSGGRLRSSIWNMFMRADVLEDNVAYLDVISNNVRRWPQGNLWYLYGSFFFQWIAETYGEQAIRLMIDDYAHQVIPYAINRSIRRATGHTYEEMYPSFIDTLERESKALVAQIRARGQREGTRITFGGQQAVGPRFTPDGDIMYLRDDGHSTQGIYKIPITRDKNGKLTRSKSADLIVRTLGGGYAAFLPDKSFIFDSIETYNNIYGFYDLFWLPRGETSTSGTEGNRVRLTEGFRAYQPDVSSDGKRVTFATNHRGTSFLQMADLDMHAKNVKNLRTLVRSNPYEQAYSPRFSPDGHHVAYSSWSKGGYRDIRIVDVETGTFENVMHDRAVDSGPCWSPDGKRLYFHSDRVLGVMNIFVYDVEKKTFKQVTNVINGALQPAISADEKTLVYLGYTHEGFDLFAMDLDPSKFLDVPEYTDDRPPAPPEPTHIKFKRTAYNPLHTFRPWNWLPSTSAADFGQAFGISVNLQDIANFHNLSATLAFETGYPDPQFNLSYTYGRLPFDMTASVSRSISPGATYSLGKNSIAWVQSAISGSFGINYSIPRAFETHNFSLNYSLNGISGDIGLAKQPLNPYDTPHLPQQTFATIASFGWSYGNALGYLWGVSQEKGFNLSAGIDLSHPVLGSDYRGFRAKADFTTYVLMPWKHHHAVALHAGGGMMGGSFPGGNFYVGGWVDLGPQDQALALLRGQSFLYQSGFVLRGYPVAVQQGAYYALGQAEYRFPIVNIDRGLSTVPIFLNRISGNVFFDVGSSFDDPRTATVLSGVGAEVWVDSTLGYFAPLNFRVGYARGLAAGGIDKVYFVAAVPY
jgi:hypothetical protein